MIIPAPGIIIKEIWESKEYRQMFHEIFNNLHEENQETNNQTLVQYY